MDYQTEDKFDFDDYYGGHYEESLVNGLATLADLLEKFVLTLNQRIPSRKMKYEELVKKSNPDL